MTPQSASTCIWASFQFILVMFIFVKFFFFYIYGIELKYLFNWNLFFLLELSCGESGYGESVKSEPTSPFPPSPPDSDHSDGGGRRDSPPLSPQLSMVNVGGLNAAVGSGMVAQSQRPFAPIQSVQIQSQQVLQDNYINEVRKTLRCE